MILINKKQRSPDISKEITNVRKNFPWNDIVAQHDGQRARAVFDSIDKTVIQKALYEEQHGLCAYCMRRLSRPDDFTIEHVKPVSKYPELALEYRNWAAVCGGGRASQLEENQLRVLSCDASKKEQDISVDVYNRIHMAKIRYSVDGRIYTFPADKDIDKDINMVLHLNGEMKDGKVIRDTSTHLVQGRKEAVRSCERLFENWSRNKRLTAERLNKEADRLLTKDVYDEFVGVKVYFLRHKARSLSK